MLVEKPRLQDGKKNYNQVAFTKHSLGDEGWRSHVTRACRKERFSNSERQPLFLSSASDGHEDSQPGMWEGQRSLGD